MRSRSVLALMVGILLAALTGCAATLPSREQMLSQIEGFIPPQQPKEQAGLVYVVRPSGLGGLVRFNIFVDDPEKAEMEAGYTRGGQYLYFFLAQGDHKLYSVAENTAEGSLTCESGKTYYIQQTPHMGFLYARNQLKLLDETEGKYLLKQCIEKPGTMKRTSFP